MSKPTDPTTAVILEVRPQAVQLPVNTVALVYDDDCRVKIQKPDGSLDTINTEAFPPPPSGPTENDSKVKASAEDTTANYLSSKIRGSGGLSVNVFSTPTLAGLEGWFCADEIDGGDGDKVSLWLDKSGNNNIATQTNSNLQPTLKTGANGINGLNVVRVSNSGATFLNNYLTFKTNDFEAGSGASVFFVAKTGASLNKYGGVVGLPLLSGVWWNFSIGNDSQFGAGWVGNGTIPLGPVDGISTNTVYFGEYIYDKQTWGVSSLNNSIHADTSYPSSSSINFYIGSNTYTQSQFNGDIAEILIYNRPLDTEDRLVVETYLKHKWGLAEGSPSLKVSVGYPDGVSAVNNFAIRYVHPAGDDNNDGKRWETAKATVLGAWDSLDNSDPSAVREIYIYHNSYVGGEVPSQGIWLYADRGEGDPGNGWREFRPTRFIGVSGYSSGSFIENKAVINFGHPGDSQSWDLNKPLIWCYNSQSELTFKNLQPNQYGFCRLGVSHTGDRAALTSNLIIENVSMAAPPDTSASYGPGYDCGWLNVCFFKNIGCIGSAVYRSLSVTNTDNANATTKTWTFENGSFTSLDIGSWIVVKSGANSSNLGQFIIENVIDSKTIVTVRSPVTETFTTSTSIDYCVNIQSDDHAGFLIKPNIDENGAVGTTGGVNFDGVYFIRCGIKYYAGAQGFGLLVRNMLTENGPMPHPIQLDVLPGTDLTTTTTNVSICDFDIIEVADGYTADTHLIWMNPLIHEKMRSAAVFTRGLKGTIYGPARVNNIEPYSSKRNTSAIRAGQYGIVGDGWLSGRTNAGRRLGAPTSAPFKNLASHTPSSWTAINGAVKTLNTIDVFGGQNGCDIDKSSTLKAARVANETNRLFSTGDIIMGGVWVRSVPLDLLDGSLGFISVGAGSYSTGTAAMGPLWQGNGEWQWCGTAVVFKAPSDIPVSTTLTMDVRASTISKVRFCYPLLIHLKANDGVNVYSETEAWELLFNAATWNPDLATGVAGTLRNQPFVAAGGLGVDSTVTKVAGVSSGQLTIGSIIKYEPRFDKDGTTVIGWVPIYSATVNG